MNRREARTWAVQALYQADFGTKAGWSIPSVADEEGCEVPGPGGMKFLCELFEGVQQHQTEIDATLGPCLKEGWTLERLSHVDRAILRLATYELLYDQETPPKVVLNEAVELAKCFSGDDAPPFINGILAGVLAAQGLGEVAELEKLVDPEKLAPPAPQEESETPGAAGEPLAPAKQAEPREQAAGEKPAEPEQHFEESEQPGEPNKVSEEE